MLNKVGAYKRHLILVVKVLLAAALIDVLMSNGRLDFRSITIVSSRLDLFLPALLCLFAGIVISGVRWWILLAVSGNKIHLNTVLSLQLIGSFFSTWLPGAAGGDAVRSVQIFRLLDNGRSTALLSIVTDRVFALLGLISIAVCVALFLPTALAYNASIADYIGLIKTLVLGIGVSLIIALALIWLTFRFSLLEYVPDGIRRYLNPIMATILIYKKNWPALVMCWVISMLASGIVAFGIVLIAAIFTYAADPLVSAIAGVFGNVVSAIPLTPGGRGVGESIFAQICTDLSARAAPFATIYFTFRFGMLIVNIPGMIISLLYDRAKHRNMSSSYGSFKRDEDSSATVSSQTQPINEVK